MTETQYQQWAPTLNLMAFAVVWIGQRWTSYKTRKALKIESAAVKKEFQCTKTEQKSDLETIKALLNGDKLEMYRQRADMLTVIANVRNQHGDVEAADRASIAYNKLRGEQAILMANSIQAAIDKYELFKKSNCD